MAEKTEVASLEVGVGVNSAPLTGGIKKAANELSRFEKTATKTGTKVRRSFFNMHDGIATAADSLDNMRGGFGAFVRASGPLAGVAITAVSLGSAFYGMAKAGEAAELRMKKLNAILSATNGAVGLTAKELDEFAKGIARNTAATRDEVYEATNLLLGFERVTGDTFKRVLVASQDLAAQGFGDIADNAQTLGEALEDPAGAIESLAERGVIFSESQKEVVKRMAETNRVGEAQALILERIESKVSGVGAASGMAQGFKNIGDALSDFGAAVDQQLGVSSVFGEVLARIARGIKQVQDTIAPDEMTAALDAQKTAAEAHTEAYEDMRATVDRIGESEDRRHKAQIMRVKRRASVAKAELQAADERVKKLRDEERAAKRLAEEQAKLAAIEAAKRRNEEAAAKIREDARAAFESKIDRLKLEGELLKANSDLERLNAEIRFGSLQNLTAAEQEELRRLTEKNAKLEEQAALQRTIADQADRGEVGPQQRFFDDEARAQAQDYFDWFTKSDEERAELGKNNEKKLEDFKKASMSTQIGIVSGGLAQMTSSVSKHSRKMFEINKAAGIATALVNTYQGVTKALAELKPPYSFVAAAATAAAGMAQVRAIQSQTFGGGGGSATATGGGASAGGGATAAEPEPARRYIRVEGIDAGSLFDSKSVRALIRQIGDELGDGVVLAT